MTEPGHQIGRFEILALLGRGGMGAVYRARDTRLGRDVAIKVLPPAVAGDRAAIGRFEQEARSASALNHPNIVTIYDVGEHDDQPFIVTELLEGQTLRDRLSAGRLALKEAVEITVAGASALAAAHAAGIIHRDVKPENIFLAGKRRQVKLLDFGIARLVGGGLTPHLSPGTSTNVATSVGSLIGTPGYMSPEQAKGEPVDGRADIFSLGCVLYEMLSGAKAFGRTTDIESIAAIISAGSPSLTPSPEVPPAMARVVDRALHKDRAERFQTMDDFAFAVANAADIPASPPIAASAARRLWPWMAAAAIVAAAIIVWPALRPDRPSPGDRFALRASVVVPSTARPISPVLAPDGSWVAYIGLANVEADVYVQFLNGGPPVNLTRGQNLIVQRRTLVGRLELSRDGRSLIVPGPVTSGIFQLSGIWTLPAPAGGPANRVTDKYASLVPSYDGKSYAGVIANPLDGDGIGVMAADGSSDRVALKMTGGEHVHQIAWSPDDRYIYYAGTLTPNHVHGEIYRIPSAGGTPELIVRTPGTAMFPAPTPDGKAIVYAGDRHGEGMNLWWHPLDGSPERRLTIGSGEYTEPNLSRDGSSLVCLARRRREGLIRVAANATDAVGEALPSTTGDTQPTMATDSQRVYVTSSRTGDRRIWSVSLDGEGAVPLTAGGEGESLPAVSPDGRQVAFVSARDGRRGIWVVAALGSTPRLVTHADVIDPPSWAPDSRRLIYAVGGGGQSELRIVDVDSGRSEALAGSGRLPAWAPGQDVVAVIRSTNNVATVHLISLHGGEQRAPIPIASVGSPIVMAWSPDGQRLAMVNLPGRGFAEAWVLDIRTAQLRRVVNLPAPNYLDGVTWTPDGQSLILGRTEFENEVLLIQGLPPGE